MLHMLDFLLENYIITLKSFYIVYQIYYSTVISIVIYTTTSIQSNFTESVVKKNIILMQFLLQYFLRIEASNSDIFYLLVYTQGFIHGVL